MTDAAVTLYSQPECGPCFGMKTVMNASGVQYTERDVHTDDAARDELVELYADLWPDELPHTPLLIVDDELGHRDYLRSPHEAIARFHRHPAESQKGD